MGNRGEKIDFNLYLITDRKQIHPLPPFAKGGKGGFQDLLDVIESALKGGVKAIQLREKDLSGKKLFELAKKLRILTKKYNAKLLINDRVDIAIAVDADGVHLGQTSFSAVDARKLLGSKKLIGVSTHSLEEALDAQKQAVDFITFGPVFYTKSKAKYGEPLGIERLREIIKNINIPVIAIGGIKLENIKEVMTAGVNGVAMISEVMAAEKPKEVAEKLLYETY